MTKKTLVSNVIDADDDKRDQLAEAWVKMVSCIVHDVTSPLVTIRIAAGGIEEILPDLIEGYLLAARHDLITPKFSEKDLEMFGKEATSGIKKEVTRILDFLKLLFPYNQIVLSGSKDKASLDALAYVDEVLKKYPFTDEKERYLIQVNNGYTFAFNDLPPFIECLFLHLLDRALTAIRNTGKGELSIWAETEANYHLIHFKDTSKSIEGNELAHVFSSFFAKREGATVPGLGFCRLALLQNGGDVVCHSVESYTDLIVKFPRV